MDKQPRTDIECKADEALAYLAQQGAKASLVGSFARRDYDTNSDIDNLVVICPRSIKYRLESGVEDILGSIPFDLIYAEELPVHVLADMLERHPEAAFCD